MNFWIWSANTRRGMTNFRSSFQVVLRHLPTETKIYSKRRSRTNHPASFFFATVIPTYIFKKETRMNTTTTENNDTTTTTDTNLYTIDAKVLGLSTRAYNAIHRVAKKATRFDGRYADKLTVGEVIDFVQSDKLYTSRNLGVGCIIDVGLCLREFGIDDAITEPLILMNHNELMKGERRAKKKKKLEEFQKEHKQEYVWMITMRMRRYGDCGDLYYRPIHVCSDKIKAHQYIENLTTDDVRNFISQHTWNIPNVYKKDTYGEWIAPTDTASVYIHFESERIEFN